tara:strand:- start:382 stop:624 length:243 start_codon:yes stop_codon:yes gene_type:complete
MLTKAPLINKMTRHTEKYREETMRAINTIGKFYAASARHHMYITTLTKIKSKPELPDDIIKEIALLCWDPWELHEEKRPR